MKKNSPDDELLTEGKAVCVLATPSKILAVACALEIPHFFTRKLPKSKIVGNKKNQNNNR